MIPQILHHLEQTEEAQGMMYLDSGRISTIKCKVSGVYLIAG